VNPLKSQLWYGIRSLTGPRRASLRAFRPSAGRAAMGRDAIFRGLWNSWTRKYVWPWGGR